MASNLTDFYRVLGLASNASDDDIKRCYKKLAVKYHPDKTSDTTHHELFIKIQEAYETLKDPEKRRKYDREHRKSNYSSYKSYSTSMHTSTSTSASTTTSKTGRTPGYYGFYQHFYRSYQNPDIAEKQKQAQEEKVRKDREDQSRKAAKIAKEKVEEQLRRDREERIMRERELEKRKERERYKEKENEREAEKAHYNERKRDAYRKEWENTFTHFAQEDDVLDQYFLERRRAQDRAKDKPVFGSVHNGNPLNSQAAHREQETPDTDSLGQHGHDSSDPIVLDDDGVERHSSKLTSNTQSSTNGLTGSNKKGSNHNSDSEEEEFVSALHESLDETESNAAHSNVNGSEHLFNGVEQLFNTSMNLRPRQEPSRLSKNRRSVSPTRNKPVAPNTSYVRNNSASHEHAPSKRPKTTGTFAFDDLKDHLGGDIGNVDFSEVLESLPKDSRNDKTRKVSDDITSKLKAKRPRVAEYTNGTSKAETLHIPINRNSVKGHYVPSDGRKKILTMLDLHASPTIHNYSPPTPPEALLSKKLTKEIWMRYVSSIRDYQSDFLNYKKHIVQYQLERSKKDEEYFELINSSSACFEVYQQCLERDFKVIQEYTELLRAFTSTMDIYKQNCNWIKMSNS